MNCPMCKGLMYECGWVKNKVSGKEKHKIFKCRRCGYSHIDIADKNQNLKNY